MPTANMQQTNTIIHPHYACAIGALNSVVAIPRAIPIANCGPGCADKQYFMLSFNNGFQGAGYSGGGSVPSSNLGEQDIVFGGMKKLDALVKSSLKIMDGDLYVVLTGCSSALVGDDIGQVIRPYQEAGHPIVYVETAGFKGNNLVGHELVVNAIIDQYVGDYAGEKRAGLVNLWAEIPYFNSNWRGDYMELKRILEGAGLKVNVLFGPESRGIKDWKNIPKAQCNLVISPWVGLKTAKHLEEKYGQPFLHIPVLPVGEEATASFIREVVAFTGIKPNKSEAFIAQEAHLYYYFLEHFTEFFSEYWYGLPSKFAVVGDSTYNIALTKFLADQIGLIPVKQIITENTPPEYRDSIRKLYADLTEGCSAEVEFIEDGYLVEQELAKTSFGSGVPLILGSSWESDVVRDLKGLLLEVSAPSSEEVVLNRSYIGYRGALTLLERIYTATVGGK